MIRRWWYGVVLNVLFYSSWWAFVSRFDGKLLLIMQLLIFPVFYCIDLFYIKSVALATQNNVPYFTIMLLGTALSVITSLIISLIFFKQPITIIQIIGIVLTISGIVILNIK